MFRHEFYHILPAAERISFSRRFRQQGNLGEILQGVICIFLTIHHVTQTISRIDDFIRKLNPIRCRTLDVIGDMNSVQVNRIRAVREDTRCLPNITQTNLGIIRKTCHTGDILPAVCLCSNRTVVPTASRRHERKRT